jgi:hypothetical protein
MSNAKYRLIVTIEWGVGLGTQGTSKAPKLGGEYIYVHKVMILGI